MAGTRRRSRSSLRKSLFEQPKAYDFFQLVRLMEVIAAQENASLGLPRPDPVGSGAEPGRAALVIRSAVPLGFAASEATALRRPREGGPVELTQTVLGLTGPSGVMPHALSEVVQVSVRERNPALRNFLDLFNNRLAGLLYDGWAKYRPVVGAERAETVGTPDNIDFALRSIVGFGTPSLKDALEGRVDTLVFFGGHISRRGRSALAVQRTLSGALGHDVRIVQFNGEWLPIAPEDQTRLPEGPFSTGAFARLGSDALIGQRTFDVMSSVVVCVGPLTYPQFRSLLPDGARARELSDLAAIALGAEKSFKVRLELLPGEAPPPRLDPERDAPEANRLGWNTWLPSRNLSAACVNAEFRPAPHLY